MKPDPRAIRRLIGLASMFLLGACSWFTDFKQQPKIKPWETEFSAHHDANGNWIEGDTTIGFRGNPQMSVPITGMPVAGFQISYSNSIATIDSFSPVPNPVAADARSVENGRKYYQINCAVCHGPKGAGDGPATKYGLFPPSLLTDITKNRTDGYIYGMIRNGRGLMPTYDRIEDYDRWDVVNYVRALQGKLSIAYSTDPAGSPGQNGKYVPGATRTAPTRPAPYFRSSPRMIPMQTTAPRVSVDSILPAPAQRARPPQRDTTKRTPPRARP